MFQKSLPVLLPSHVERLNSANADAGFARSQFITSANVLEQAADELDALALDLQNELDFLSSLLETAVTDSDGNREAARRIRALVAPSQAELTLF